MRPDPFRSSPEWKIARATPEKAGWQTYGYIVLLFAILGGVAGAFFGSYFAARFIDEWNVQEYYGMQVIETAPVGEQLGTAAWIGGGAGAMLAALIGAVMILVVKAEDAEE